MSFYMRVQNPRRDADLFAHMHDSNDLAGAVEHHLSAVFEREVNRGTVPHVRVGLEEHAFATDVPRRARAKTVHIDGNDGIDSWLRPSGLGHFSSPRTDTRLLPIGPGTV